MSMVYNTSMLCMSDEIWMPGYKEPIEAKPKRPGLFGSSFLQTLKQLKQFEQFRIETVLDS